jgi:cytosine/adenosine deaminase-related metal-dependent hydrolase
MLINGREIVAIGNATAAWAADAHIETFNAQGMAVFPGLINTHHHLYQTFSRNMPALQNMELFDWLKASYLIWQNLNEDVAYYSSLAGLGELLKNGCTTSADHHYVFPHGAGDITAAQFAASELLGMRLHAARGSMDVSKKDGGLPPDSVVETIDQILKAGEDAVHRFHDSSRFSMKQVFLAPCSPFSVSAELLRATALQARELGVRLHTHLAETRDEEAYTLERFGMRPLAYMENVGWLGSDVWYAHGIHFNDQELTLLAQTGTGVAHCPTSNMKLASGVACLPEMLAQGVTVGLAADSSTCGSDNLLEELRVGFLLHRLSSSSKAPSAYDMLKVATRGSAQLLGRTDLGSLEAGKAADFFLVDLERFACIGACDDIAALPGTVGLKAPADYVFVNGRMAVEQGCLCTIDEKETVAKSKPVLERYRA